MVRCFERLREFDRRPAARRGAQGGGARRCGHPALDPRVADGAHPHEPEIEAGLLVDDLAEDGVEPLAHLGEAGEDVDEAVVVDLDEDPAGVFETVADPGVLDAAGDAGLGRRFVVLTHRFQGAADAAALVHQLPGGETVARVEDVSFADVVAVEPDLLGEPVEDALHGEGGLVGAETAHGAARRVVGVDGAGLDRDIRHPVRAAGVAGGAFEDLGAHRGVGAGVADHPRLDRGEAALGVAAGAVAHGDGVALGVDPQALLAGQDDLDGPLKEPGGEGGVALDREILLAAEGAAVGHEFDVDPVGVDPQDGGDLALVVVDALALGVDGEPPARRERRGTTRARERRARSVGCGTRPQRCGPKLASACSTSPRWKAQTSRRLPPSCTRGVSGRSADSGSVTGARTL